MRALKIAVFASGRGSNLQSLIDAEKSGEINGKIELVVSNSKDSYALVRAEKSDIDSLYIRDIYKYSDRIKEELKKKDIDLVVLAGYMSILDTELVEQYRNRIINVHPSLIPSFCGRGFYGERVHKAVLEYGVKVTGATVHFVDENADTGPIIVQKPVCVEYEDTIETLSRRVLKVEHELLKEAVRFYCDGKLRVLGRSVKIRRDAI